MATILLILTLLAGLRAPLALLDPILIQSLESHTISGGPVFNRIAYFPGPHEDVWMMQQSHHGPEGPFDRWDRLAIVVTQGESPRTARFYQLAPGPLNGLVSGKPAPYRAACFMCHSNGPRAIRPDLSSVQASLGIRQRINVFLWNLRIKTYFRTLSIADNEDVRHAESTPFRYPGPVENRELSPPTCVLCHNESSWGRGQLTRQNFMAISFMLENGFMPPPGFALDRDEKMKILRFARDQNPTPSRIPVRSSR